MACPSSHCRHRPSVSRALQEFSDSGRRSFADGDPVCGTKRVTGQSGETRRALAMVEFVAARERQRKIEIDTVCVADGDAAGLGRTGQHGAHDFGAGGVAAFVPAWNTIRFGTLAAANSRDIGSWSHAASPWPPQKRDKMNVIGSRPLFFVAIFGYCEGRESSCRSLMRYWPPWP
jgi:hypothetical protein